MNAEMLDHGPDRIFPPDPLSERPVHIQPYHETKTSHDDQEHGHKQDIGTLLVTDETVRPHDIDPCITECGHRGEYGLPDPPQDPEPRNELHHIQRSSQHFHKEGSFKDHQEEMPYIRNGIHVIGILKQQSIRQCMLLSQHHDHNVCDGDHTESSDLDQTEDHDLSEECPVCKCIHDHESRHTDGCGILWSGT